MQITSEPSITPLWGPEVQDREPLILLDVALPDDSHTNASEIIVGSLQTETEVLDAVSILQPEEVNIKVVEGFAPGMHSGNNVLICTSTIKIGGAIKAQIQHVPSYAHKLEGAIKLRANIRAALAHKVHPLEAFSRGNIRQPLVRVQSSIIADKYQMSAIIHPQLKLYGVIAHMTPPQEFTFYDKITVNSSIVANMEYTYVPAIFTKIAPEVIMAHRGIIVRPIVYVPCIIMPAIVIERR